MAFDEISYIMHDSHYEEKVSKERRMCTSSQEDRRLVKRARVISFLDD